MTSVRLKYILEDHLPFGAMWIQISKACIALSSALFSFAHVFATYLIVSVVDFLLYRRSHHLSYIDFNCEIGLLVSIEYALLLLVCSGVEKIF